MSYTYKAIGTTFEEISRSINLQTAFVLGVNTR